MKIFIDTNIFLDLILKRENYKEALAILNAVERNKFEGVILDITILNIDYIARKQTKDIREFLKLINKIFKVFGASNNSIEDALDMANKDLEDNLQYITAKESNCEIIITNDKSFVSKDIVFLTSEVFCKEKGITI